MKRHLVKLDDDMIEIKQDAKGKLIAKKLSPEDLLEVHVIEGNVQEMLDNDFNKITNETLNEVRQEFKSNLKENVLKMLGFSSSWGRSGWEVDHCNGRDSVITQYITSRVKEEMRVGMDTLLKEDIEKMLVTVRKGLVQDFKEMFDREVRDNLRREAAEAAKAFMSDLLTKQITKVQKQALAKAESIFLTKQDLTIDSEDD